MKFILKFFAYRLLLKTLLAFVLCFLIAMTPAFALPKSPFLGMSEDSPHLRILRPDRSEPSAQLPLLEDVDVQVSASVTELYSIHNVAMFDHDGGKALMGMSLLLIVPMGFVLVGVGDESAQYAGVGIVVMGMLLTFIGALTR